MARVRYKKKGKRVNIWLTGESTKIASQIDNLSGFIQMALKQASSIMAFDIILKERNLVVPEPTAEAYDRFNEEHPLNGLTQKRTTKHGAPQSLSGDQTDNSLAN